jgi:hypothetical protein
MVCITANSFSVLKATDQKSQTYITKETFLAEINPPSSNKLPSEVVLSGKTVQARTLWQHQHQDVTENGVVELTRPISSPVDTLMVEVAIVDGFGIGEIHLADYFWL